MKLGFCEMRIFKLPRFDYEPNTLDCSGNQDRSHSLRGLLWESMNDSLGGGRKRGLKNRQFPNTRHTIQECPTNASN